MCSIMGYLGEMPLDKFKEDSLIKPSSPYSASKASADLLVNAYHRTYGLNVSISRCSNNYGPYQFPEKLIPTIIQKLVNNEKIPIYGNGLNIRDWIYVDDHCEAITKILSKSGNGEIYNIGGENERTNIDVARIILSILHKDESSIEYVKDRPGHDRRYAISNNKMNTVFSWKPKMNFEEGIKKTVYWYLTNSTWVNTIKSGEYIELNNQVVS